MTTSTPLAFAHFWGPPSCNSPTTGWMAHLNIRHYQLRLLGCHGFDKLSVNTYHPISAIFGESPTTFCTYSMGSHDTLRHCQRARACRCGGEKSRALRQGRVFQLFVQMALWDTLGSGMDQHFVPELFAGTSKTTTFYKVFTAS